MSVTKTYTHKGHKIRFTSGLNSYDSTSEIPDRATESLQVSCSCGFSVKVYRNPAVISARDMAELVAEDHIAARKFKSLVGKTIIPVELDDENSGKLAKALPSMCFEPIRKVYQAIIEKIGEKL